MKTLMLILFLVLANPLWAADRYLDAGKVLYEKPLEEDVLKVNTALGYCTVLEFSEKPMMVTVGDNSLIQVEIPQNSKNVVIKPIEVAGETNLFVLTPSQRFNYNVSIGDPAHVDYVLDSKQTFKNFNDHKERLSFATVLKMARSYAGLKSMGVINQRVWAPMKKGPIPATVVPWGRIF